MEDTLSAQIKRHDQAAEKLSDAREVSDHKPRPTLNLYLMPKWIAESGDPTNGGPSLELGASDQIPGKDLAEEDVKLYWRKKLFQFAIPESADQIWDSKKQVGYMCTDIAGGHRGTSKMSLEIGKPLGLGADGECREANISVKPVGENSKKTAVLQRAATTRATVKLLYPGKFNKHEVELLFGLRHPNIVRFYGCLARPDGYTLLMEFIRGMTLYERLKKPPELTLNEALLIYRGLLRALEHLQQNCLVHGDIHILNVMVVGCKSILIDFSRVSKQETPVLGDKATGAYHFDIKYATECLQSCLDEKHLPSQVEELLELAFEDTPSARRLLQEAAFRDLPDDDLTSTEEASLP